MAWKAKANITRHLGKGQEGYKTDRKQNCFPWSKRSHTCSGCFHTSDRHKSGHSPPIFTTLFCFIPFLTFQVTWW